MAVEPKAALQLVAMMKRADFPSHYVHHYHQTDGALDGLGFDVAHVVADAAVVAVVGEPAAVEFAVAVARQDFATDAAESAAFEAALFAAASVVAAAALFAAVVASAVAFVAVAVASAVLVAAELVQKALIPGERLLKVD